MLCRHFPGQTTNSLNQPSASAPPYLCGVFGTLGRLLLCKLGVQPVLFSFEARQVACILLLGPALLLCLNMRRPQCCRASVSVDYMARARSKVLWPFVLGRAGRVGLMARCQAQSCRPVCMHCFRSSGPHISQNTFRASQILEKQTQPCPLPFPTRGCIDWQRTLFKHQAGLMNRPLLPCFLPQSAAAQSGTAGLAVCVSLAQSSSMPHLTGLCCRSAAA